MKKKEVLIVFVLAVLVTILSGVFGGWPWAYFFLRPGIMGPGTFSFKETRFVFDFLFWFLAIFAIWRVVKWIKGETWKK